MKNYENDEKLHINKLHDLEEMEGFLETYTSQDWKEQKQIRRLKK